MTILARSIEELRQRRRSIALGGGEDKLQRRRAKGLLTARERLAAWFEAADIFLFASVAENFPCVILEAMAAQCCVVATPTGGVTEQIRSRATGLLSASVAGESLAAPLREAIQSPQLRQACGARARAAAHLSRIKTFLDY